MCAVFFWGIDLLKNSIWGGGLKFVFKFKIIIPKIGGHMLAEGSRLSVPAPRRIQIFFQACLQLSQNDQRIFAKGLFSCYILPQKGKSSKILVKTCDCDLVIPRFVNQCRKSCILQHKHTNQFEMLSVGTVHTDKMHSVFLFEPSIHSAQVE